VLPNALTVWIEECAHVRALEQPDVPVSMIESFHMIWIC